MEQRDPLVQFQKLDNILENDPGYVRDFCNAAITSFITFKEEYHNSLMHRDLSTLRKAGHRIKPVAQLIGVEQVIEEYEKAKSIIADITSDKKIRASIERMEALCDRIIRDFETRIAETK